MSERERSPPRIFVAAGHRPAELDVLSDEVEIRPVDSVEEVTPGDGPAILILDRSFASGSIVETLDALHESVVVVSLDAESREVAEAAGRRLLSLEGEERGEAILRGVRCAIDHATALLGEIRGRRALSRMRGDLRELNRIGMALMSERDPDRLLELILDQALRITTSDAGSLYLVEHGEGGEERLRFRLARNASLPELPAPELTLPIDEHSVAGYVAVSGEPLVIEDAYDLPDAVPYTFNRAFDQEFGYRAKSMLAVPMRDHRDRTVGVLQLINRKRTPDARVRNDADAAREVLPYGELEVEVVQSLAGQAAVSIENGQLYRSIEELFEGFIKAAVTAIDQRDPTTSGHSIRVATLTCDLAEMADRSDSGPFRGMRFTREQMKELRYAGLLHDFGKVGVREHVLVKEKKLPPVILERIEARFDLIRRTLEAGFHRRRADLALERGVTEAERAAPELHREYEEALLRVDRFQEAVRVANEPRVLPEEAGDILEEFAGERFPDFSGNLVPYLTAEELRFLSIPKGSLDPDERKQIESHVAHTYQFLLQIPWTEELSRVADIAYGHHEKLDGSGYPRGIMEPDIPVQTRMMTVADIFDALTAADRPYKRAMHSDRAISILEAEARDGQLDPAMVRLLVESGVYRRILEEDWRTL